MSVVMCWQCAEDVLMDLPRKIYT